MRLFPNRCKGVLFGIGLTCANLWSEINYEKRHLFFKGELTIVRRGEINKKYYHKYKEVLGVNAS